MSSGSEGGTRVEHFEERVSMRCRPPLGLAHLRGSAIAQRWLEEARRLCEPTIGNGELALGPEPIDLARTRFEYARLLRRLGELDRAREQVERAHAIHIARLGTANSASNEIRDVEDPKSWPVNELVVLDGRIELLVARGDAEGAETWRQMAYALRS